MRGKIKILFLYDSIELNKAIIKTLVTLPMTETLFYNFKGAILVLFRYLRNEYNNFE